MNVYYLNSESISKFLDSINKNLDYYKSGKLDFVKVTDLIKAKSVPCQDFKLDTSFEKPSDSDFENIKRIYLALKELKDSQASEEILWVGLCHCAPFGDYIQYRWDCKKEDDVKRRYFCSSENYVFFNNALARLWWYGRLTYDEDAKDPFELTKYICENLTTKGFLTITFKFSNNRKLTKAYLRAVMNFEKNKKIPVEKYNEIRRRIDFWGGKLLLDAISDKELTKMIEKYLETL